MRTADRIRAVGDIDFGRSGYVRVYLQPANSSMEKSFKIMISSYRIDLVRSFVASSARLLREYVKK